MWSRISSGVTSAATPRITQDKEGLCGVERRDGRDGEGPGIIVTGSPNRSRIFFNFSATWSSFERKVAVSVLMTTVL